MGQGREEEVKAEGSSRTKRGNVIDLKGDVSGQALDKVPAPSPTLQTLLQPIDPAVLPKSGWWRTLSTTVPCRGRERGEWWSRGGGTGGSARLCSRRQLGSLVKVCGNGGWGTRISWISTTDAVLMLHSDAIRQTGGDGRWRTDRMGKNKHAFQWKGSMANWLDNMLPWWCHNVYTICVCAA